MYKPFSIQRSLLVSVALILSACSVNSNHTDLRNYIADVKKRPAGNIEAIPTFRPYESFVYASAGLRSPFDRPIDIQQREFTRSGKNITPDFNRAKEYLEGFELSSLQMVGTLKQGKFLWALIKDAQGGIHRVKDGNFLGTNHGRIVSASETKLDLVEIVSDGLDGWVERPRILALSEKE